MYTAQGPARRKGATEHAIIGVIILVFTVMPAFPAQVATFEAISPTGLHDDAAIDGAEAIAWTTGFVPLAQAGSGGDGTEFTPLVPITVTALGYYDDTFASGPGLSASHEVGIYDLDTFQLVVSATVPAGNQVELVDVFRIIDITPTDLVAGRTYVLAAVSAGDYGRPVAPASLTVDSRITMVAWRLGSGPPLSFPSFVVPTVNFFLGPTFLFTAGSPVDTDGDGVPDDLDECPNTIPKVTVDGVGCPPPVDGDFDRDGDVDLDDYKIFQQCMSGANAPADPDCGN